MALKNKKFALPDGWEYELIAGNNGRITEDDEPVVSFSKSGRSIQYGLMSNKWKGRTPDEFEDEKYELQLWVEYQRNELFRKADLHHWIRFESDSPCYFDFISLKLIGACGKRGGKDIEGKPVSFTNKQLGIFLKLVESPNFPCSYDVLYISADIDTESDRCLGTLTTHINSIKNYDTSLRNTIKNANSGYSYIGNAECWAIGSDYLKITEIDNDLISLDKVFSLMGRLNIVVSNIPPRFGKPLQISPFETLTASEKLAFLVPPDFIDVSHIGKAIDSLVQKNKMEADTFILNLYKTVSKGETIGKLWDHIKDWITENYKASVSASSYYGIYGEYPTTEKDIYEQSNMNFSKSIRRIHLPTREYLEASPVAEEFFRKRNTDIEKETSSGINVFDYVVALVLASFYYCRCPQTDAITQLKKLYKEKLRAEVQSRFSICVDPDSMPPLSGDDIDRDLQSTYLAIMEAYAYAEAVEKQFDMLHGAGAFEKYMLSKHEYSNDDLNSHNPSSELTR